jgi:uncharacterized protein (DUF1499 family)
MNHAAAMPPLVQRMRYISLALLLLLPISVITVRAGAWKLGLPLYALACLGSTLLVIISIVLLMLPRFAPWRQAILRHAFFALPGTLLLLALVSGGGNSPRIHDITTDTADPPTFTMAAQQRGEEANSLEIDPDVIAQQQAAYPDMKTLASDLPVDEAFSLALQTATDLGWEVYHQDREAGVIEAVDTTSIMAFKDDVVIRVRESGQGALIDVRSVSRVGEGDIGANAKRIREFREAFQQPG